MNLAPSKTGTGCLHSGVIAHEILHGLHNEFHLIESISIQNLDL